jgi:hypothetical protein
MNKAKLKQIGFIALVAVGTTLVINSLAKRAAPVAKLKSTIDSGI